MDRLLRVGALFFPYFPLTTANDTPINICQYQEAKESQRAGNDKPIESVDHVDQAVVLQGWPEMACPGVGEVSWAAGSATVLVSITHNSFHCSWGVFCSSHLGK